MSALAVLADLAIDVDHESWAYRATASLGEVRETLAEVERIYGLDRLGDNGTPIFDWLMSQRGADLTIWQELAA